MKTLHLSIIVFLAAGLVAVNNSAFADGFTSYGGLTGFRQAHFQGNHGSYPIWYKLTNGTVVSTLLDLPAKALLFMINTSSDGQLIVQLPRSIIDSKNQNADKPFFVGVGGVTTGLSQVNATETNDDYLRTLKIGFTKNTDEIEIVGTYFIENYHSATKTYSNLLSPLKQFKSGVAPNDVVCRPDMQLLIQHQENFPICVKLASVSTLLYRDWSYPTNCKYVHDPFTAGVEGLIMIEKNATNPSSGKSYSPSNSTVVIGWNNTVSWINQDVVSSSVTSDWNLFDSGPILPGKEWQHDFECAGNYVYHSESHPWMKGWIRVLPPRR